MSQEYGSLVNLISGGAKPSTPEVGMGVTEICWSDRRAGTITWVSKSGKSFKWQQDRAIRMDESGMSDSQQYRYEPDVFASVKTARMHKNGKYYTDGRVIQVGARSEYYDFSF